MSEVIWAIAPYKYRADPTGDFYPIIQRLQFQDNETLCVAKKEKTSEANEEMRWLIEFLPGKSVKNLEPLALQLSPQRAGSNKKCKGWRFCLQTRIRSSRSVSEHALRPFLCDLGKANIFTDPIVILERRSSV